MRFRTLGLLLVGFHTWASLQAADSISWLPRDAYLITRLPNSDESTPGVQSLREMLGFLTDSEELLAALPMDWTEGADSLVVGAWEEDGETQRAVLATGNGLSLPDPAGGTVTAKVASGVMLLGSPRAVARCLQTRGGNVLLSELRNSLESRLPGPASAWVWTARPWVPPDESQTVEPSWTLSSALEGLRSSALLAWLDEGRVRFRMTSDAGDADVARFLAVELQEHLVLAGPGGESPLQQSLDEAVVGPDGDRVSLELVLDAEVLGQVARSQNAQQIFRWELSSVLRERRERIPELARLLEVSEGSRVADIGTGRGFLALRLARSVGEQGRVWAVDIQEAVLKIIENRADRDLNPQLETVLGSEADPRLPSGSLDAAVIVNAYHEMPQHREMLVRIHDALRAGGRLMLLEPFSLETRSEPRETQVERHHISPELLQSELEEAGFEITHREDEFVRPEDSGSTQRNCLVVARKP